MVTILCGEVTTVLEERFTQRYFMESFPVLHKVMDSCGCEATLKANLSSFRIIVVVISTFGSIGTVTKVPTWFMSFVCFS